MTKMKARSVALVVARIIDMSALRRESGGMQLMTIARNRHRGAVVMACALARIMRRREGDASSMLAGIVAR